MRKCNTCHREIEWTDMRQFGTYSDDKKVWCPECWKELQDFMKKRWFEDKPEEIFAKLNTILVASEKQKKDLINLISNTRRTITDLEKYCNQKTLNFEVNNGNSKTA